MQPNSIACSRLLTTLPKNYQKVQSAKCPLPPPPPPPQANSIENNKPSPNEVDIPPLTVNNPKIEMKPSTLKEG